MSIHRQRPRTLGYMLLTVAVCVGLVAVPSAPVLAQGDAIHVAPTGDDSGPGTEAAPYRTVDKAAHEAQPGDTVLIHAGLYRELVEPIRGGTDEDSRITYTAAGDGEVVIKGSEEIDTWFQYDGDVWAATLPNSFFGNWNPYSQCHPNGGGGGCFANYTAGDVYLDEEAYSQKASLELVGAQANTWYAEVGAGSTTIFANFDGTNPNSRLAEINVRRQIFAPSVWGLGYITVRGLTFMHAANTYSDFPDQVARRQAGAVSVYGGLKWIIEQNKIINARTIAIDIGLSCDIWAGNRTGATRTHFHDTDLYGHHIVRGNYIARSGQSGIVGVFSWDSEILYNMIEDTNYRNEFSGSETAPIKVHYMNEGLIKGNYILRSYGGNSGGIWTDWGNQAVRVTGNIVMFSPWGYYAEAVFG
ncbi:MAG: hypothetical protein LBJ08_09365, partial [Bifidobacteriaceae bacterium]|nr:hypothetical protein [Bifidobacteriaceae bacterium]